MKNLVIGIVGAGGKTGVVVARELLKITNCDVIVAGRDREKLEELARSLGLRASSEYVDVNLPETLDALCQKCNIIINCAGPCNVVLDKVANAALKNNCHYIDVGGYDLLMELLAAKHEQIKNQGLLFCVCAGWIPGLSGIFPRFVNLKASELFKVDSVEIYYGGRDKWSLTAGKDMIWALFLDQENLAGVFENGKWVKKSMFNSPMVELPLPMGKQRALPFFDNQLRSFSQENNFKFFGAYVSEVGNLTALTLMLVRMFLNKRSELGARMILKSIEKECQKYGSSGMVHVVTKGHAGNEAKQMCGTICTQDNYRLNGLVPAITAQILSENKVANSGAYYLCDAVEPVDFMTRISSQGFGWQLLSEAELTHAAR
jgi:hypothetical protein